MKTSPKAAEPGTPFNFAQHLITRNAERPDKAAFIDDQGPLSYGELATQQRQLAAALLALGYGWLRHWDRRHGERPLAPSSRAELAEVISAFENDGRGRVRACVRACARAFGNARCGWGTSLMGGFG